MTNLRVITRVVVVDQGKLLLARNKDANFWYPPGGGWEFKDESLQECVVREVQEETGYTVTCDNLLWVREFREPEKDKVSLETFWRARLSSDNTQTMEGLRQHIDQDPNGAVEECRWFATNELVDIKILPKFLKEAGNFEQLTADAFVRG